MTDSKDSNSGRRIEDAALRFIEHALSQPATDQVERKAQLAKACLAFHEYAKQQRREREGELAQLLRRVTDPQEALPRIVERVGQAAQLLRQDSGEPTEVEVFLARDQLADALALLGRKDLIP